MSIRPIAVTIPVKNEEGHIGACIDALGAQTMPFTRLILVLNNCVDATLEICRQRQTQLPNIEIIECRLEGALASAGEARRLAWQHAAACAENGVILTTDADAQPGPFWIEQNMKAIGQGADAVCGIAELNPSDSKNIRSGLHFDELREAFLLHLLDEIKALVDPEPADPWPRHQQNSGASIALRSEILRLAGGAPAVCVGEDRALIEALYCIDARIRHAPEIRVAVSGRLEGRAEGGMASTIKRRSTRQDALTDIMVEPAIDAYRRAKAHAHLRAVFRGAASPARFAKTLLIDTGELNKALNTEYLGTAWARVQAASPVLHRRRVAFAALARETRQALTLRDELLGNPDTAILANIPHAVR